MADQKCIFDEKLKMKEFIHRHFLWMLGLASTWLTKGVSAITGQQKFCENIVEPVSKQPELLTYLLIGIYGALGGLAVKIVWGITKRIFPKLKKLDS